MKCFSGSLTRVSIATLLIVVMALLPRTAIAAPTVALGPRTSEAFDRYAALTQKKFQSQLTASGPFLWIDTLPSSPRNADYASLRAGNVVIEEMATLDGGRPIAVPGGIIHHWIATVFIPGATLEETLSLEQDYDHHQIYFQPDVVRSRLLHRNGDDFDIYLRLQKTKIITVVLDTEHEVHYETISATRAASWSRATRIQQVENAGTPTERLDPPGQDNGFLWGMNTYWKFEQKDGGTYVESQSVSLTRDIPFGLGWMIGPFVESVPRESLTFTLAATRAAVLARMAHQSAR
ncbi:MAG TPA: hypothetical protein VMU43_02180 [Candidatus Acidoferrum sp.]|nr:hypothetical protein [Candidatus Acidoferrum sp.]